MGVDRWREGGTGVVSCAADGDIGRWGCCPSVMAGAVLGRRLAWEGGTPLSCPSSCALGVEEVRGSEAGVKHGVRSIPESMGGSGHLC